MFQKILSIYAFCISKVVLLSLAIFPGCPLETCISGEAKAETYLVEGDAPLSPVQAGLLAFLLQYCLCEERELMDVEQRMGGFGWVHSGLEYEQAPVSTQCRQ